MSALHTILRAAKAILALAGFKQYAVAAGVADVALTAGETAIPPALAAVESAISPALARIFGRVQTHAADGASTVFLAAPDMNATLFNQYADAVRAALAKDAEATGTTMPRVVLLPPGMTLQVLKETADEFKAALDYLKSTQQGVWKL
jgi:hypothetical protein